MAEDPGVLRGFKKTAHAKFTQRIQETEHTCVRLESGRHRPKMLEDENYVQGVCLGAVQSLAESEQPSDVV